MQEGRPVPATMLSRSAGHVDRRRRILGRVPGGEHAIDVAARRHHERQHVGEIEVEAPADRPARQLESRDAGGDQRVEEAVERLRLRGRPCLSPSAYPRRRRQMSRPMLSGGSLRPRSARVARQEIAHLAGDLLSPRPRSEQELVYSASSDAGISASGVLVSARSFSFVMQTWRPQNDERAADRVAGKHAVGIGYGCAKGDGHGPAAPGLPAGGELIVRPVYTRPTGAARGPAPRP